ncbi:MAG TPA: helix-turn-helix transcriptional regulator [Candidatus Cybelea sp.]|jgi:transcriptional regulator with XRE-family HTH domain|nr:helix-turn-helix transcriptional regulator [Candidatus Cybelea sp.]
MNSAPERRAELSDFLRTRRAKIVPSDVGLADGARRRTPGLRREEVALLANIGATWYTRLEQGLPINVSAEVLGGIARALRLTSEERRHLHLLAGVTLELPPQAEEVVGDLVQRVLTALEPAPAYVRGRRWDVLAWNRSADALSAFSSKEGPSRNLVWRLFRDPTVSCRLGDPDCMKRRVVAQFRAVAAKYPGDPAFVELIDELRATSDEFRELWAQHDVLGSVDGLKRYVHPELGELTLDYTAFALQGDGDIHMVVLTAAPGSESERKLQLLAAPAAT